VTRARAPHCPAHSYGKTGADPSHKAFGKAATAQTGKEIKI